MKLLYIFFILILFQSESKKLKSGRKQDYTHQDKCLKGGTPVQNIKNFPFVASLVRKNGGRFHLQCGAAIIASLWAVTAARCFSNLPRRSTFNIRCNSTKWDGIVGRLVDIWRIHENYDGKTSDYDVALVHVVKAFPQKLFVMVAPSNHKYVTNSKASVVGWGVTKIKQKHLYSDLSHVSIKLQDRNTCKKQLKNVFGSITKRMFCAGGKRRCACGFNFGGPIYQYSGKKRILIGVASSGPQVCAKSKISAVYTKLAAVSKWIEKHTKTRSKLGDRRRRMPGHIIGGQKVNNIKDHPFVAAVVRGSGRDAVFRCGASIIATRWVVTAAHCFFMEAETPTFNVRCCTTRWAEGVDHLVTKRFSHELYTGSKHDYDVAVVQVASPFTQSSVIMAAPYDYQFVTYSKATILGWGLTVVYSQYASKDLHYATVKVQNLTECRRYHAMQKVVVTDRMFCAGDEEVDSCTYDSGGPIYQYSRKYKRNVVIGVVSWGLGYCSKSIYSGVYVNLASVSKWIENRIRK